MSAPESSDEVFRNAVSILASRGEHRACPESCPHAVDETQRAMLTLVEVLDAGYELVPVDILRRLGVQAVGEPRDWVADCLEEEL